MSMAKPKRWKLTIEPIMCDDDELAEWVNALNHRTVYLKFYVTKVED
jgi:predicted carbohydrate-binding protein with CBM5 and CBM33 domain